MSTINSIHAMVVAWLGRTDRFLAEVLGRGDRGPLDIAIAGDEFEFRRGGNLVASVPFDRLRVTSWDQQRFDALERRIVATWSIYETLDSADLWSTEADRLRLETQLEIRRRSLSRDFRDLLRLVDLTLGARVSDHFPLRLRERNTRDPRAPSLGSRALSA